jgi:hypothetical protein
MPVAGNSFVLFKKCYQSITSYIKTTTMKKTNRIYWIFTSLFAFMMLGSAIPDIFSAKVAVEGFAKIGMPAYLVPFLGIAKALGVVAILVPGYPRIKEWAYAGLTFDLIGATWSIAASGQPAANWIGMLLPILLAAVSYRWYHKKISLAVGGQGTQTQSVSNRGSQAVTVDTLPA